MRIFAVIYENQTFYETSIHVQLQENKTTKGKIISYILPSVPIVYHVINIALERQVRLTTTRYLVEF